MSSAFGFKQNTLLVIEKDAHTAYLLNYMLSREGYEVITSSNCETTRSMVENMTPPEAVFLDINYIREHHCELIHTIRKLASWNHVPVLLLAEQQDMDHVQSAMQAGATDFIIQPFNTSELLYHLQTHSAMLTSSKSTN
jgi:two-component system chemotaxis response regulator CheY